MKKKKFKTIYYYYIFCYNNISNNNKLCYIAYLDLQITMNDNIEFLNYSRKIF